MADEQTNQADLFKQLEKNDVKVDKDAAEKMKENIMKDRGGSNYLGLGVHDVVITSVELAEAKTGTIGLRFNVENENGQGNDTFWLSEAALPYSIENISRIMVHNTPADKKAVAKNFFANILSAKELYEVVQTFLEQAETNKKPLEAFLVRKESATRTYTDKNGEEKPSIESQLQAWKPNQTATEKVVQETGGEVVDDKNTIGGLPF